MATSVNRLRKRSRKPRFYKRKGFWLGGLLLGLLAGVAGYVAVESYTREYRERAETYDLDRINELEVPSVILDRNGKEIGRIYVQSRSIVRLS